MGLCCCKCKDDDDLPYERTNQRRRTVSISEQGRSNSGYIQQYNDPPLINTVAQADSQIRRISKNTSQRNSRILGDVSSNRELREELDRIQRRASFQPIFRPILVECTSRRAAQRENIRKQIYATPNIQNFNQLQINNASSRKVIPFPHSTSLRQTLGHINPLIKRRQKVVRNVNLIRDLLTALQTPRLFVPSIRKYIEKILDKDSKSYKFAMSRFRNKKFNSAYEIRKIGHIWNPYIFLQYSLNKEKCKSFLENRLMYHGTQIKHLDGILTHNFDWRKVKSAWYGYGVYFANNPWYASHYSKNEDENDGLCAMILARVLVGETCVGNRRMIVPAQADTARNPNGQAFVKFDDGYFYPEFVIYFEKIGNQSDRLTDSEDEWMLEG